MPVVSARGSGVEVSSGPHYVQPTRRKSEMAFEVSKHFLVPKHSKLSETEKNKLLERYNIDLLALPKILKEDPALAKLDVKVGDVVKIERKSKTAGTTAYYRVIVEA